MMPKSKLQGKLLVADPAILGDPSFHRAVVLVAQKGENSALGFILNKPLDISLNTLLPEIEDAIPVFFGGPVDPDNLFYIHTKGDLIPNSIPIDGTWHWGGSFEDVVALLQSKELNSSNIRFFMGYSGWEKEQLEEEMKSNSWVVVSIPENNVLALPHEAIWAKILFTLGGEYKVWAHSPENPSHN